VFEIYISHKRIYDYNAQRPIVYEELTFILLMSTFGRAPNNASKWEIGFNSVA